MRYEDDREFFSAIIFIIILIIGVIAYFITDPNWGTKEHTVYIRMCKNLGPVSECPNNDFYYYKRTYLAFPESGQVIVKRNLELNQKEDPLLFTPINTYKNCQVFNAENWNCSYGSYTLDMTMQDGKYYDFYNMTLENIKIYKGKYFARQEQVSRMRYHLR